VGDRISITDIDRYCDDISAVGGGRPYVGLGSDDTLAGLSEAGCGDFTHAFCGPCGDGDAASLVGFLIYGGS
jgi:hypothetical protein